VDAAQATLEDMTMAGQKRTNRLWDAIEANGGEDLVFIPLSDGETLTAVCRMLQREYPDLEDLSRGILSTWCNQPQRKERYLEARRMGAVAFAEESMEIVDGATPETAYLAKTRSDTRKWFAGRLDRDAWGQPDKAAVQLNINQMHLDAVRELGGVNHTAIGQHQMLEGEVVEEEPGEGDEADEGSDSWLD